MVPTHQQSHQMAPLISTSHYYDDPVSARTSTANGYKCTTLHCILLSLLLGSVFAVAEDQNFDSQMYSMEEMQAVGNVVAYGRAKREYNQTKIYDMKESDGATMGMVVIQLDKHSPQDQFKLQQPNKWVTVDPSGAVRVKQPWDYEQLDKSKTIEFLVECNPASDTGDQSHQRVVIQISDVNDEKPYFINRPLPMQTVVPLNAKPGESVFKLEARDPDTDHDIHYIMVRDRTGGRFEVDEQTGDVRVRRTLDPFLADIVSDKEYVIYVIAYDRNGPTGDRTFQATDETRLSIIGGKRVPQFYAPRYEAIIPVNKPKDSYIVEVKAKSFAERQIRFTLKAQEDTAAEMFTIDPTSGIVRLAKELDFEKSSQSKTYKLMVVATEESKERLSSQVELTIVITDVKAPIFPQARYEGNVNENGTANLTVMTMTAMDVDEGSNAHLKYAIELNQVNENGKAIFKIDENTGTISTRVCCLDRELTPEYTIKVVATDEAGLKDTGTATIKVKDINDMPPEFTKKEWNLELDETERDLLPEKPILVVSVKDLDLPETNRFSYKVLANSPGADRFLMVTNSDGTGSLKVAKALDYEDPQQRAGFNITIQVSDNGDSFEKGHIDRAKVNIRLRDINDNQPEFEKPHIEVTVQEDSKVGTILASFEAKDADRGGMSRVSYAIERSSDKKRHFTIDKQNGTVNIQRMLDREQAPRHHVKILAIDDGIPARTATASLVVVVTDINDNAPRFLKDYLPVLMEHQPPRKVVELLATDDDDSSKGNGGPFTFKLAQDASDLIKELFDVQQDKGPNGDGMAIVYAKAEFDRELQKEYLVPIVIQDSGRPSKSGTSTLTVIIGDSNDNRMHPGSKHIFVYNFRGLSPSTSIGRVLVEDDDDWDLPDKSFAWDGKANLLFELNPDDGMITMKTVINGDYFLQFRVHDREHSQTVLSNVSVTVRELPEEVVENSGSIRVSGITAEDFIRIWLPLKHQQVKSKYQKFKEVMSRILKVDSDNLDVFSVITRSERPPVTDIRFAAHDRSSYLKPVFLNGAVTLNRKVIEHQTDIKITMVGIDECLDENDLNCASESCTNVLKVYPQPIVVNANRTSFVGVNVDVKAKCICRPRDFDEPEICSKKMFPPQCLNHGRCTESSVGALCTCPKGYTGPRCEMISRTFHGDGWAWYSPLQVCSDSHLSIEFMTQNESGLLFYNGPLDEPIEDSEIDFVSLELRHGNPRFLIDFGSGTAELIVQPIRKLHDGEWHRIDLFWTKETARIVVDNCVGIAFNDDDPSRVDRSRCENITQIVGFNQLLNVNSPLQVGGVFHKASYAKSTILANYFHLPTKQGFNGCIRNLIHNSVMYDLGSPGSHANSEPGCSVSDKVCRANSINSSCVHGQCLASHNSETRCVCESGWTGPQCDQETISKMFQKNSFIKYALSFEPDPYRNELQLRFRTRQKNGELFRVGTDNLGQYLVLEVKEKKLRFRYKLDNKLDERELWLPFVSVSDGQWHTVKVQRFGSTASIELDGGGGRRFNEITDYEGLHQLLAVDKQNVMAGGFAKIVGPSQHKVDFDFEGCMSDIQLDGRQLPMENGAENAIVVEAHNIITGCPSNNPCEGIQCNRPFECVDLWNKYECSAFKR